MASDDRVWAACETYFGHMAGLSFKSEARRETQLAAMSAALDAADAVASEWRPIGEVPACGDNDLVEIYLANPDPVSSLGIKIVPAWCWPFHGSATHWRPHVAPGGAV
jgi:hypothetical protein